LSSIGLPTYTNAETREFNHELLAEKVEHIVYNLNRIIDVNFYPTENCERSNRRHRPIGIGVQGLAEVFMKLGLDWESADARRVNKEIFETIYYAAIRASNRQARERCEKLEQSLFSVPVHPEEAEVIGSRKRKHSTLLGAYSTFEGSPMSRGEFQFDMWQARHGKSVEHSGRWDWETLRADVIKYGIRNSLLVAPMPTASTSQILGFTECFEPITSNIYSRRTQVGEFPVVNKMLMKDCIGLGIWNEGLKNRILVDNGSVQNIPEIPAHLKAKYKTVWEIKQKTIIDMSVDRGHYICQSQSLNLFLGDVDMNKLSSMHIYGWKQGLKTGQYYLRIRPVAKTQQFTITPPTKIATQPQMTSPKSQTPETEESGPVCRREAGCVICSS
jgi:ribonucleoside-diphosphate reductase alpha chain